MFKKQKCKKCHKIKSINRFRKYRHTCKLCERVYSNNWNKNNKKKQQKICFNYKNLQPLWMEDNISKGNKERRLAYVR